MDGWMDGYKQCMHGLKIQMDGWMDKKQMDGWMDRKKYMFGWIEKIDGWLDVL